MRSQSRLVRQSNTPIRECFVLIEPNFQALSLQWLNRTNPLPPAVQNNNDNDEANVAGPSNQNVQKSPARRSSVASCRNLFEVDGTVEETGFDFLNPRVSHGQRIEIERSKHHDYVRHNFVL